MKFSYLSMRVLFINVYSLENAYQLWEKGISGSHHVWGKVELDSNGKLETIILPHIKYPLLNRIGKWFGIGFLDQQIRVLLSLKKFDVLYSPYSSGNTKFLSVLKLFGLFRKPIVVTLHQPYFGAKHKHLSIIHFFRKKMFSSYDACIFLSPKLKKDTLREFNLDVKGNAKYSLTQWGPDQSWIKKYAHHLLPREQCTYFISAGHTDRDFETLIEAFRGLDFKLKIFCTPKSIPKYVNLPKNVYLNWDVTRSQDLIDEYKHSIAILIPLKYPKHKEGCQGMTSLQDVVVHRKPTIMTKNLSINIDVEKEGFGMFVPMYDVLAWKKLLTHIHDNQEAWEKMCVNSDRVLREKFNSKIFGDHLEKVILKVGKSNPKS